MKFVDKDGNVFDSAYDAASSFCITKENCGLCPAYPTTKGLDCRTWAEDNPTAAAALMGYTIIEENEPVEEKKYTAAQEITPGIYRHFKGGIYEVLMVAEHSETGEPMVVYANGVRLPDDVQPQAARKKYVRPLVMFASKVDKTKYPDAKQDLRFERIADVGFWHKTGLVNITALNNLLESDEALTEQEHRAIHDHYLRENKSNVERHSALCREINNLYARKNHDYGDSFHETYLEEGMAMVRIRLSDKLSRFKKLTKSGSQKVADESIRDTLMDLANYSMMTVMEIDRERSKEE